MFMFFKVFSLLQLFAMYYCLVLDNIWIYKSKHHCISEMCLRDNYFHSTNHEFQHKLNFPHRLLPDSQPQPVSVCVAPLQVRPHKANPNSAML